MTKLLKDFLEETDHTTFGPASPSRSKAHLSGKKNVAPPPIRVMRDGGIRVANPKPPITGPEQCLQILRAAFSGADKEIVMAIRLDGQSRFLGCVPVAWGTINHAVVYPRHVFEELLDDRRVATFILAHNHPSGDPTPSADDMVMLDDIRDLGRRLDCKMVDFIIIGEGDTYYSHRELYYDAFQ